MSFSVLEYAQYPHWGGDSARNGRFQLVALRQDRDGGREGLVDGKEGRNKGGTERKREEERGVGSAGKGRGNSSLFVKGDRRPC